MKTLALTIETFLAAALDWFIRDRLLAELPDRDTIWAQRLLYPSRKGEPFRPPVPAVHLGWRMQIPRIGVLTSGPAAAVRPAPSDTAARQAAVEASGDALCFSPRRGCR